MYKVIRFFTDLQDNNYAYRVGETFPREGVNVTPERLEELAGSNNKRGIPVIEKEEPFTEEAVEAPVNEVPEEKPKPRKGKRKG